MDLKPLDNKGESPSPLESNKKAIIIASIVVGVLLLGGVSYGVYYKVSNTSQQVENKVVNTNNSQVLPNTNADVNTNTSKTSDTSDWKTYKNDKQGFELKYPNGWNTEESQNEAINAFSVEIKNAAQEKPKFLISVNPGGVGYEYLETINTEKVLIDGSSANKISFSADSDSALGCGSKGIKGFRMYFDDKINSNDFWIWGTFCQGGLDYTTNINQILSTFKFTNPEDFSVSDWKTYQDTKNGFEFKYPQTYDVQIVKDGIVTIKSPTRVGLYDVNIQVNQDPSLNNLSLDAIIQNKVKSHSIIEQQKTTLAGQTAYEGVSTGMVNEYTLISKKGNNLYELLFNTGNKDSLAANKTALDVNQKLILSTFKFTK